MKDEKIYDIYKQEYVEMPDDLYAFMEEIESVCVKHGFSISHEDYMGGFLIEKFNNDRMNWFWQANKAYKGED